MDLSAAKRTLRGQARAHRRGLLAELDRAACARAAGAYLLANLALPPGAVVSGYLPFEDEFDCLPALAAFAGRGHPLALPAVGAPRTALAFRAWRPGDPLRDGVFGTREPLPEAGEVRPAALLVPLLAVDPGGWRLGYGGGFYDRTVQGLRATGGALAVGIAFAGQIVAAVPHGPHDARLDALVTETGFWRFG